MSRDSRGPTGSRHAAAATWGTSRSTLRLLADADRFEPTATLPELGRIGAGPGRLAVRVPGDDRVHVPGPLTSGEGCFALQVSGDSMIGAGIHDGDWVIVHAQPDANNGDIVAAALPSDQSAEWEATVKTLQKGDGEVWLVPHNPACEPIPARHAKIFGRVTAVVHQL